MLEYEHAHDPRSTRRTRACPTTSPVTSCGSASAPASSTAPTSSCSATSRTRSAGRSSARPRPRDDALALGVRLNPTNEAGRLTFISRFGAGKIRDGLPGLIEKVTPRASRSRGSATRCTATPSRRARLQDPPLRRRHRRGRRLLRRAPLARHLARRPARRAHRRRRDRVRRRRRGAHRDGPLRALRVGLRPAAEPGAESSSSAFLVADMLRQASPAADRGERWLVRRTKSGPEPVRERPAGGSGRQGRGSRGLSPPASGTPGESVVGPAPGGPRGGSGSRGFRSR